MHNIYKNFLSNYIETKNYTQNNCMRQKHRKDVQFNAKIKMLFERNENLFSVKNSFRSIVIFMPLKSCIVSHTLEFKGENLCTQKYIK